jgi:hypothetical protein
VLRLQCHACMGGRQGVPFRQPCYRRSPASKCLPSASACLQVHEPKKSFYKKFLYEPFPVESSLPDQLPDHFNAEVVAGAFVPSISS